MFIFMGQLKTGNGNKVICLVVLLDIYVEIQVIDYDELREWEPKVTFKSGTANLSGLFSMRNK